MSSPINKSTNNPTEHSQLTHDIPSQTHGHDNAEEETQELTFCYDVAVVKEIQMGTGELYCKKIKCLICVLQSGVEFKIGAGFTEYDSLNPPKIGETIQFCCAELVNGKPRFPRYLPSSKVKNTAYFLEEDLIILDLKKQISEDQIKNEGEQKEAGEGDISKLTKRLGDLSLVN